jgi:hypothetical protein
MVSIVTVAGGGGPLAPSFSLWLAVVERLPIDNWEKSSWSSVGAVDDGAAPVLTGRPNSGWEKAGSDRACLRTAMVGLAPESTRAEVERDLVWGGIAGGKRCGTGGVYCWD